MEAPQSSSAAAGSNESKLRTLVSRYKLIYFLIRLSGYLLLLCVVIYVVLLRLDVGRVYTPMQHDLRLGNIIAADSSGNLLAFPVYNDKDSTAGIMVRSDSTEEFKQLGGPWKVYDAYGASELYSIAIAPDNKSIVAIGDDFICVKPASADSFICVSTAKWTQYGFLEGICFAQKTDSAFIYNDEGSVFCLNYKRTDSFAVARLQGINHVISMSVNKRRDFVVAQDDGVTIGSHLTDYTRYATSEFKYIAGKNSYREMLEDSTSMMNDTSAVFADSTMVYPSDTSYTDTTK